MSRLKLEKQRNLVNRLNEMKKSRIAIFKRNNKQHENILNKLSNIISPNSNKNIFKKPDDIYFSHNSDFTSIEKKCFEEYKNSRGIIKRGNKNKKSINNDNENNIYNNHNYKNILIKENTNLFSNIKETNDKYIIKENDRDNNNKNDILNKGKNFLKN